MKRSEVAWGLGIAFFFALIVAAVVQTLIPGVAKLPGLLLCPGGSLEVVLRRRTSYGVCTVDGVATKIAYMKLFMISIACWWVVFAPIGIWGARAAAKKKR